MKPALLSAWLALSALLLVPAGVVLLVPEAPLLRAAAACRAPGHGEAGERCALCGMSRALLALRRGDVEESRRRNEWALPLTLAVVLNQVGAGVVAVRRLGGPLRSRAGRRRRRPTP